MKSYNQHLSIMKGGRTMVLALLLFVSVQGAHGQTHSNPLYQEKGQDKTSPLFETNRTAGPGHAARSDSLLRLQGTISSVTEATLTLSMRAQADGNDLVLRKRPGRAAYTEITLQKNTADAVQTKAEDYNSSRSNNTSRSSTGGPNATTQAAPVRDYNSSRSNNASRSSNTDGSLEHTDDWIAVRASAPGGLQVVLIPLAGQSSELHIPTDVHSGRLTGVRRHTPVTTTRPIDAATPYLYKASIGEDGAFVFDAVAPGTYEVCVVAGGKYEFRGHVTVLK